VRQALEAPRRSPCEGTEYKIAFARGLGQLDKISRELQDVSSTDVRRYPHRSTYPETPQPSSISLRSTKLATCAWARALRWTPSHSCQ
jgi:hypothetical protein